MKNIFTLLLVFSLFYLDSEAQTYMVKKDGEVISFTKRKIKKDIIRLTTPFEKKLEINLDDIVGYYSLSSNNILSSNKMFYKKLITDPTWGNRINFIERAVEGKINVYIETVSSSSTNAGVSGGTGPSISTTSSTILYLEKDNEFFKIFPTGTFGVDKKKIVEKFKSLVYDDKQVLDQFNSEAYKHKRQDIIRLVNEYNSRAFVESQLSDEIIGRVMFFRRKKGQHSDVVLLSIGDNEYNLSKNDKVETKIPYNQAMKVCVTNVDKENCTIISGSKYFIKYYEVDFDKEGKVIIENKDKSYSEFHISKMK